MGAERRRIEPWPLLLAGLLASMMAASFAFWVVAARNPDPLVVDDAYEAGRRLNDELRLQQRAAGLGVALSVAAVPEPGGVAVSVVLRGADGGEVAAERVVVRRERPAEGGLDEDFELSLRGGAYVGRLPLPRRGRWRLVVTATVEGLPLRETVALWAL